MIITITTKFKNDHLEPLLCEMQKKCPEILGALLRHGSYEFDEDEYDQFITLHYLWQEHQVIELKFDLPEGFHKAYISAVEKNDCPI
jgi:hypothetical protein